MFTSIISIKPAQKMFYELYPDKAKELITSQIVDGWLYQEIKDYFYALGYDIFFIQSIVNPFFINPTK